LLQGERTGVANPKCYARSANDCSKEMSKEHWISKNILKALTIEGRAPTLEGLPWLRGTRRAIPAERLDSRILCERHNRALSPLDADAGKVFRAAHRFQDQLVPGAQLSANTFLLTSGVRFELWLLKLALGGLSSGSLPINGRANAAVSEFGGSARVDNMVEILFRGRHWPETWGFFVFPRSIDPNATRDGIRVSSGTNPNGQLIALSVGFGIVSFDLAFGTAGNFLAHRPGAIALCGARPGVEKVVAFAWPSGTHTVLELAAG